jgi:hypothetical protein
VTLRRRIGKLEATRPPVEWPRAIYICAPDGDPCGALIVGGGSIEREGGESAAAFEARALMAADANLRKVETPGHR